MSIWGIGEAAGERTTSIWRAVAGGVVSGGSKKGQQTKYSFNFCTGHVLALLAISNLHSTVSILTSHRNCLFSICRCTLLTLLSTFYSIERAKNSFAMNKSNRSQRMGCIYNTIGNVIVCLALLRNIISECNLNNNFDILFGLFLFVVVAWFYAHSIV